MKLIKMAEYRSRETVAILSNLLAQAERGELAGLAVCAKPLNGKEQVLFTSHYRKDPAKAAYAAMQFCVQLAQSDADDEAAHSP